MSDVAERVTGLRVPARLHCLDAVAAWVGTLARTARLSRHDAYRLRLAVDELVTNTVEHGYRGRPGAIDLDGDAGFGSVLVRIADRAPRFDPRSGCRPPTPGLPAERRRIGSLGIYLALTGVDSYDYAYRDGANVSTLAVRSSTGPPPRRR